MFIDTTLATFNFNGLDMCNILIHSDDKMFRKGITTLLLRVLASQVPVSGISVHTLHEERIPTADIIVMSFSKGEEKTCHKILQSRKNDCVLIGFYSSRNFIFNGRVPLCLNKSIFIKRTEPISNIANRILQLWLTRFSLADSPIRRACLGCKHSTLSPQQISFVSHFSNGSDTKEIARQMNIMPKTVSAHKRQIMLKFGLDTDSELLTLLRCIKNKSVVEVTLNDYLFANSPGPTCE